MHEVKPCFKVKGSLTINGGYEQLEILIFNRAPDPDAEALERLWCYPLKRLKIRRTLCLCYQIYPEK